MSGLVNIERGWAAVPPAVAAAPGGIPNPRSAAEADVGTGRPAPGPSPGRPGMPGCGPIAAPGGSCWACTCWRSLGRSGLCCCNGSAKFSTFITSKEHRFLLRDKKKKKKWTGHFSSLSLFAKCFFSQHRAVENDNFIEINVKARINKLVIANKIDFTFLSWGG